MEVMSGLHDTLTIVVGRRLGGQVHRPAAVCADMANPAFVRIAGQAFSSGGHRSTKVRT